MVCIISQSDSTESPQSSNNMTYAFWEWSKLQTDFEKIAFITIACGQFSKSAIDAHLRFTFLSIDAFHHNQQHKSLYFDPWFKVARETQRNEFAKTMF